jgi:prenyltransferase beta subunit
VFTLLPELADERSVLWLETEWRKDLSAEVKLTYKGALTLKAFASADCKPKDLDLIPATVKYLLDEQNEDGGFGPWKDHPIGSEPWSTGTALIGLTAWPELLKPEAVERALAWLARVQLPNGLWPCHYIEEGSAYCYWGAVEAMKYLKRIGR